MKFNPEEYETVKSRKERFYKDHIDGRISVELINATEAMKYVIFKAQVFMSREDQEKGCPRGVGYALEVRDTELSVNSYGKQYESVNYSSWTENCEESAVGRALDNAGYSGNKKPSREEMAKANKMNTTMASYNAPKTSSGYKQDTVVEKVSEGRICPIHKITMSKFANANDPSLTYYAHVGTQGTKCYGK